MIVDKQPVTHVRAVAVDRQGLAVQRPNDDQGDQLLGEVIRAVVVRAVGNQNRQAVGMAPGAHQVIRRRLGRRIGRTGIIGRGLGKEPLVAQRAKHFVGRDVMETERSLFAGVEPAIIAESLLQHHEGADHIGLNKLAGSVDRTVHMALGGQVSDHLGLEVGERLGNAVGIGDVSLDKLVARTGRRRRQGTQHPGIGQLVVNKHLVIGMLDQPANQGRTDKAGAAGDQNTQTEISLINAQASRRQRP